MTGRSVYRACIGPAFLRFVFVGMAGFAVDAGVLVICLKTASFHPLTARVISFSLAVLSTFELNRRWTFRTAKRSYLLQLSRYLSVQGVGFIFNIAIYAALYALRRSPFDSPLICLAVASGAALLINFTGAHFAVFRNQPGED